MALANLAMNPSQTQLYSFALNLTNPDRFDVDATDQDATDQYITDQDARIVFQNVIAEDLARRSDVNKDGFLDLAAMPRLENGPRVWLGNGKGQWADSSSGLFRRHPSSCGGGLSFDDINRDGHLDMAAADHCQGLFVYLGDGAGRWCRR
jgi:hypothetical protein